MRCSACLTEMRRTRSGHVCPKCGQSGTVRLGDGREATFEPVRRGAGTGWAWLFAGLMVITGLASAGWWWRADLLALTTSRSAAAQVAAPAAPDWRAQARGLFLPPLDEGLIALFGTEGEDRLLAFAALGNGELVSLVETGAGEEDAVQWIVRFDGSETLDVFPVEVRGEVSGAALAPLGVDGFLLAFAGTGDGRLEAYGTTRTPRWRQALPAAQPGAPPPVLLSGGDLAYVISGPDEAGRAFVSAYDIAGSLLWQRTFDAIGARQSAGALAPGEGVLVAFAAPRAGTGQEVTLTWLSPAGETLRRQGGLGIDAPMAGLTGLGEGAGLLVGSSPPQLLTVEAGRDETGRVLLPEAALHDTLLLVGDAGQAPSILSAYRLADVQTDLVIRQGDGAGIEAQRLRLPAEVSLADAVPGGVGSYILAGSVGSGVAADIFLLAVSANPGSADEGSGAGLPGPGDLVTGAVEAPSGAPSPAARVPEDTEAGVLTQPAGAGVLTCRFSCLDEESVFPLTKTVLREEIEAAGGLVVLHADACSRLGAEAALVEPDCKD